VGFRLFCLLLRFCCGSGSSACGLRFVGLLIGLLLELEAFSISGVKATPFLFVLLLLLTASYFLMGYLSLVFIIQPYLSSHLFSSRTQL